MTEHPFIPPGYDPTRLRAWKRLAGIAATSRLPLVEIVSDAQRSARLRIAAPHLLVDLARQPIDSEALTALVELAGETRLADAARAITTGAPFNHTEGRAVLHTALRGTGALYTDQIAAERARMNDIADAVRSGRWRGHTGRPISDIVHVGIGGSALGPQFIDTALRPAYPGALAVHFADNIDSAVCRRLTAELNPETTLVVVVSKSFTTNETARNARTLRSWMLERGCGIAGLARHFLGVSSNADAMTEFGIPPQNRLCMWDWVGGRYSIWSAVQVSLAIAFGPGAMRDLLAGAAAMDTHFLEAPAAENAPMLLALTSIWNGNFLGASSHAVLPYARRLALLPNYLQQLETESNGKSACADGRPVSWHTSPVVWGGEGTIGQHAFHQLLHQGTRAVSIDFVLSRRRAVDPPFDDHDRWLAAHALAQGEALLRGRSSDELGDDPLAGHRRMPGNRGSTTVLLDDLSPASLGALLALYEHKTFCCGVIWGVNAYDQWGVELGKGLAERIYRELGEGRPVGHDLATRQLMHALLDQGASGQT